MPHYRRNLPHIHPPGATFFLTWSLFGALRGGASLAGLVDPDSGKAFLLRDRQLDRAEKGPRWLKDARVAQLLTEALQKGAHEYKLYELLAWVIMPNHVHLVITPLRSVAEITLWLKGSTARSANLLLGRTGTPFWQYESYDRSIRNDAESQRIIRYVEANPVAAGLARSVEHWPWSSAAQRQTGRRPIPRVE
jgi:REP element-mobilizing transposase RayT